MLDFSAEVKALTPWVGVLGVAGVVAHSFSSASFPIESGVVYPVGSEELQLVGLGEYLADIFPGLCRQYFRIAIPKQGHYEFLIAIDSK